MRYAALAVLLIASACGAQSIPSYCHSAGYDLWCDDQPPEPFVFYSSSVPEVVLREPWENPNSPHYFFIRSKDLGRILICDMPTKQSVANCKLGDGLTIEDVVNVILQNEHERAMRSGVSYKSHANSDGTDPNVKYAPIERLK